MSTILELTLENPAFGGDTIGRLPDGRAVFVPFCLPGETVRVKIISKKKRFARAELLEVLEPSPFRITPRCQHFSTCGGCHYQHIDYHQQLLLKKRILQDQLERIGGIRNPQISNPIPSSKEYNYRNQIQFHISEGNKPGFIRADRTGVMEISECHLPEEPLNELWPLIDIEPHSGISSLTLRSGAGDDALITLESKSFFEADFDIDALPVSVVHLGPENVQVLAGSSFTLMQVKNRDFQVSAGSFFQVNTLMAEKMVTLVEESIPESSKVFLELYSGVGLFSAFVAPQVDQLIAIESSENAVEDFSLNLDEFDNVTIYQGRAEEILPLLAVQPDIVLLDPPRAGVSRNVLEGILSLKPEKILYISCDPATLSRDARVLIEWGYAAERIIPLDLFAQTYHIETFSVWQLNST